MGIGQIRSAGCRLLRDMTVLLWTVGCMGMVRGEPEGSQTGVAEESEVAVQSLLDSLDGLGPQAYPNEAAEQWLGEYAGTGDAYRQRYSYLREELEAGWEREQEAAVWVRRSADGDGLLISASIDPDAAQVIHRQTGMSGWTGSAQYVGLQVGPHELQVTERFLWGQQGPEVRYVLERGAGGVSGMIEITRIQPSDEVEQRRPERYKLVFRGLQMLRP